MIDITLLGNSALIPLPDRAETAAVLTCEGHSILFDCGEGTQCAARAAHVSLMKADIIALTHYHGDHIFGLPGLLQTMNIMGRERPLTIVGPAGIRESLRPIMELVGWTAYEVRLCELPEEGLPLCELAEGWAARARLRAFPTEHRVPSQCYAVTLDRAGKFQPQRAKEQNIPQKLWGRLQKGEIIELDGVTYTPEMVLGTPRTGIKVVFSGDTVPCQGLVEASRNADLLICEGTYGENEQAQLAAEHGHMTFAQAAKIAAEAEVKRLWLTHFSQMMTDPMEYLPNALAVFNQTECGVDGMSIRLEFEE